MGLPVYQDGAPKGVRIHALSHPASRLPWDQKEVKQLLQHRAPYSAQLATPFCNQKVRVRLQPLALLQLHHLGGQICHYLVERRGIEVAQHNDGHFAVGVAADARDEARHVAVVGDHLAPVSLVDRPAVALIAMVRGEHQVEGGLW